MADEYQPGFTGVILTYCRTPHAASAADLAGAHVAILGAPIDELVTNRPGTRFGPRAIRQAEDVALPLARPSMELGVDPFAELRVVDRGDVEILPGDPASGLASLRSIVAEIIAAGAMPLVLGGDHGITLSILEAIAAAHGADGYSLIHFDTHADTDRSGGPYNHGTPFSRAVETGVLRGQNTFQIGLRGAWPFPEEFDWMRSEGFRFAPMDEIDERGLDRVLDDAIAHAAARAPRTYLSVDIDVLDPAFAPGTGTPEPGGLSTRELLHAVRRVTSSLDLCGMDMVEVSPPYDHADVTALAGHRIVLNALGGIALRRSGRGARPERS